MGIRKQYLDAAVEAALRINPSYTEEEIRPIIKSMINESFNDPTIIMDNNVTGENHEITLSKLCSWIEKENPVISGNATFYVQPSILRSPTSNMLRSLKKGRKSVKTKMFSYDPQSDEYQMLDLEQGNIKVIMNAEYGGSGAPTAAFYTKYSPAATTLMAQSIITTMAAFFEGFIGDRAWFFNINECYDWMRSVLRKIEPIPKWIHRPTAEQVAKRIRMHFYMGNAEDFPYINQYVEHCTSDQLVYLYYANNMKEFIRDHIQVQEWIRAILVNLPLYQASEHDVPPQFQDQFEDVNAYNKWVSKQMFLDPSSPPECIQKPLKHLQEIFTQFLYVEYLTPDSIVKLNNHKRNTVLLVDTDSNIINSDIFVSFILEEIFPGKTFDRPKMYNEMILVNILTCILDISVAAMLDHYGRAHHMDPEARAELTMKNEFMFLVLFLMLVKKRYCASIVLREGNIMIPFKAEIKGMDFIKAGVTDEVSDRFTKMLKKYILFSDELKLHELMHELKMFEKEIYQDLKHGGTKYLKPMQYKAEGAYSKAWSLPVYRGTMAWNQIFPEKKIVSLDRVRLIKLVASNSIEIERIHHKHPNEYELVMNRIYRNPNPDIQKSGLKYICVPNDLLEVPQWIVDLMDIDMIISDVVASFKSVLDALELESVTYKTPSGNASVTSGLIAL